MSCELTKRFVPGYLDGELDLVRTIEMEAHLQSCGDCARELESQQGLRAALQRASLAYSVPQDLRDRIQSSLRDSTPNESSGRVPGWRGLHIWQLAGAFAVLALCVITALQLVPD